MDVSRIAAVLQPLLKELAPLPPVFYEIREALKKAELVKLSKSRDRLQALLVTAPSNHWVPSWRRVIDLVRASKLHGSNLLRRVRAVLDDLDYRPDHAAILIEGIQADVEELIGRLRALDAAFETTGLAPYRVPSDMCEIGALFPTVSLDIDDLARELHELDRHIRTFAELGGMPGGLPLHMIQTGSCDLFLIADPVVGGIVAGVLVGIVNLLKSLAEIKKLQAETKKFNAEAAELLSKQGTGVKEKGLQEITRTALAQSNVTDAARANELAIATRQAVVYIESKVQLNVIFEVRMGDTGESSKTDKADTENSAIEQIASGGNALAEFDAQRLTPLLGRESAIKNSGAA
jgi:hypothetical protein